jgi:hypothetical protein
VTYHTGPPPLHFSVALRLGLAPDQLQRDGRGGWLVVDAGLVCGCRHLGIPYMSNHQLAGLGFAAVVPIINHIGHCQAERVRWADHWDAATGNGLLTGCQGVELS